MNRIFHVKIAGSTYLILVVFTAIMIAAFWFQEAIVGLVMALALIVNIECIIHSTYTLTADGNLVVYSGRFRKAQTIPFADITDVELKRSPGLGGLVVSQYILVHYGDKRYLSLTPVKPKEFVNALVKRLEHRVEED